MKKRKQHYSKASISKHLLESKERGLSVQDYCKKHNFNVATFYYWRSVEKKKDASADGSFITLSSTVKDTPVSDTATEHVGEMHFNNKVIKIGKNMPLEMLQLLITS